jgi:hypothetical protein
MISRFPACSAFVLALFPGQGDRYGADSCCSQFSILVVGLCTNKRTTGVQYNNHQEQGNNGNEAWNEWIGGGT